MNGYVCVGAISFLAVLVCAVYGSSSDKIDTVKSTLWMAFVFSVVGAMLVWIGVSVAYENPAIPTGVKMVVVGSFNDTESKPVTVLQWSSTGKDDYDNQIIVRSERLGSNVTLTPGSMIILPDNGQIMNTNP